MAHLMGDESRACLLRKVELDVLRVARWRNVTKLSVSGSQNLLVFGSGIDCPLGSSSLSGLLRWQHV